jgi:acetolactate synthase-1/3 small subunit
VLPSRQSSGNSADQDGFASDDRHVIGALVVNESGVLAGVATLLAGRGFNIDSLVVGRTEIPELSRMTIVINGDDSALTNVRAVGLLRACPARGWSFMDVPPRGTPLFFIRATPHLPRRLVQCVQVQKQLQDVTHVVMVAVGDASKGIVQRDLMMIKVATQTKTDRIGLIQLANVFSAKTVDVMEHHIMFELSSHPAEIERFIELCTSCVFFLPLS